MKLQNMAIIFIIIILPISIALSTYVDSQAKTINMQTSYDTMLYSSTYDAVRAFQLNTVNNRYSSVSDSKIRDIEAAISSFYNSLAAGFGSMGYDESTLRNYVPAMVYTLYDGYYIYGKFKNTYSVSNVNDGKDTDGDGKGDTAVDGVDPGKTSMLQDGYWASEDYFVEPDQYQYGLKPYIYYSIRYVKGSDDFVVNYTLDNYITIIGTVDGDYVTKSGYLINPNLVSGMVENNGVIEQIIYDGVNIERERLNEDLLILNEDPATGDETISSRPENFTYVEYNGKKIYYDSSTDQFFRYSDNYKKMYINDYATNNYARARLRSDGLWSDSAGQFYKEALDFSSWVNAHLRDITVADVVYDDGTQANPNGIVIPKLAEDESTDNTLIATTGTACIFDTTSLENNPTDRSSNFNEHRMGVIRRSITTNLISAIANFSQVSTESYEFVLPLISEEDWDKVLNNICVITFLQGIPVGNYKFYNNYSIVTNDKNKEFVADDSIYIEEAEADRNKVPGSEHHNPGDRSLDQTKEYIAYSNTDYIRQNVYLSNENYYYFYPKTSTACYNCIVSIPYNYDIQDIINGNTIQDVDGRQIDFSNSNIRKAVVTGLARCRYSLYKSNEILNT